MNNKYPQIHVIYDRKKTATNNCPSAVEIRITHNYKQKYIGTGIMLYPNQWKKGNIVNCKDTMYICETLNNLLNDIRQAVTGMLNKGALDISLIPEEIQKLHGVKISFIDYCAKRAEIRKYGKKKDSQERYNRFIRLFSEWGGIAKFEDINENNIISLDRYLQKKGMKPYSKWNNYHRFLNSFILDAINDGYLTRNPYKWVNIEKDKASHGIEKCLTPEEFLLIKKCTMPTESLERVRDLFVFQTYTCLSYSDLKDFDSRKIQNVKGTDVYVGKRHKTNRSFTIPLLPPALDILRKYKETLPIISNVKYNEYLKIVAQAAGIDKPISTHWARHTGATLLLNEGVDMRIVSKICGHSSTRITEQVYAKLLDETVIDAVSSIDI